MWSVQVELVMIPLLPLFERLSRNGPLLLDLAIMGGLLLLSSGRLWPGAPRPVQCLYCFYLGVMLPKLMGHPALNRLLRQGWSAAAVLPLLLVMQYLMAVGAVSGTSFERGVAFCSTCLIAYVVLRPDCGRSAILDGRALRWVGDRSYSFYAFHLPFLGVAAWSLLNLVSDGSYARPGIAALLMTACAILSIAASLGVAAVTYRFIELPAISRSRNWAARVEQAGAAAVADTGPLTP
jgi:peptidoglycan/LPS O-acetylase OafA/YrhL